MAFAGGGLNRALRAGLRARSAFLPVCRAVRGAHVLRPARWLERAHPLRAAAVAYPIQVADRFAAQALVRTTSSFFETRDQPARRECSRCSSASANCRSRTMRFEALEQENAQAARRSSAALPPLVTRSQLAEVVNADLGRLRQRLVDRQGRPQRRVSASQTVVDTAWPHGPDSCASDPGAPRSC